MAKKKTNLTRYGKAVYAENPFMKAGLVKDTKVRKVTNNKGDMMIVDNGTGEIVSPVAGFWQAHEVDTAKFVKLYINGVKAFKGLTGTGTKVFEVLYLQVQDSIGQERVYMNFADVDQEQTPMAESTWSRGLSELINKGFLAPTPSPSMYWLNPDYIWNGDRLAFVQTYYKKKTKKQTQVEDGGLFKSIGYDPATEIVVPPAEETPEGDQA